MNERVNKVLVGFARLTDSEKSEILRLLGEYDRATYSRKVELSKSFETRNVGPKDSYCTCCGR